MAITRLGPNQSVNLASNITGTLPVANGGTAITSGFINGTATPGKVLQVISSENAYATSTTSGTLTDVLSSSGTTWETAITPSATSSKIIIVTSIMCYWEQNGNANNRGNLSVSSKTGSGSYSALVSGPVGNYDYGTSGVQHRTRISFHYQISPSTTSAVTVKLQISSSGGATGVVNDGGTNDSSLFLYEVGA
tara:strand:+ start:121 stop:699 length:579 start_codon:yes stop_codon:yes gene_type:complete